MESMIGILSDTHDNLDAVRLAVQLFRDAGCSLLIHAGDFVAPFAARELGKAGIPVQAVYGNCDGEKHGLADAIAPFGAIQDAPLILQHAGLSILVTHSAAWKSVRRGEYDAGGPGVSLGVSLRRTRSWIETTGKYDVVIFGHTHKPEVGREGRTLVINPGEACGWLTGRKTVALLDPMTRSADILPL
jgi:hypothetical protein